MADYTESLDNFLLRNSLTTNKITVSNVDSLVEDGTLDKAKISNLNVDTITVSPTGYIRSGKTSFTDDINSGWFLGNDGIYIGKELDVSKFKFTTSTGTLEIVGTTIDGTSTIGGRTASTLAGAINSSGNLIKEVVNNQFNTSTKEILSDFTFGTSGAIKMITDANNGLWISPTGILGKKAGVTTFAVDTSGNASFRGNVVITGGSGIASLSDAGSLATLDSVGASNCDSTIISGGKIITGLLTATNIQTGTLTGILIQTSPYINTGVKMSTGLGGIVVYGQTLQFNDTSGNLRGYMGADSLTVYVVGVSGQDVKIGSYQDIILDAATGFSVTPARYYTDLGNSNVPWRGVYCTTVYMDEAGASIGYGSSAFQFSNNIQLASGHDYKGQYGHIDNIVVGNNSPLTETGSIYCDGTHFYGRIGSTWKQLDN